MGYLGRHKERRSVSGTGKRCTLKVSHYGADGSNVGSTLPVERERKFGGSNEKTKKKGDRRKRYSGNER